MMMLTRIVVLLSGAWYAYNFVFVLAHVYCIHRKPHLLGQVKALWRLSIFVAMFINVAFVVLASTKMPRLEVAALPEIELEEMWADVGCGVATVRFNWGEPVALGMFLSTALENGMPPIGLALFIPIFILFAPSGLIAYTIHESLCWPRSSWWTCS